MHKPQTPRLESSSSARESGLLKRTVAAVRRTAPTDANAHRLWSRYASVCKDDSELMRLALDATGARPRAVDGMTEVLSHEDFLDLLQLPNCLTVEVPDPESAEAPPRAFLVVPFATTHPDSIDAFSSYFLSTVFDEAGLRFQSPVDESSFRAALAAGNVVYLSEFVSRGNRAAAIALLIAVYAVIVDRILRVPSTALLGKCLESVRIGAHVNPLGNQPIKRLATSFGITKIGEASQCRPLSLGPEDPSFPESQTEAELTFGLYMGTSAHLVPLVALYRQYLHQSLFDARCR